DFHEGLNFAGIHRLPCVLICENNQYAISVPVARQMPTHSVAERASAYGVPVVFVDGNDILEVYRVTKEAVARARRGDGPTLIECFTYRLVPHSTDDDDRTYRSREEVESWKQRDPIDRFRHSLVEHGVLDASAETDIKTGAERAAEDAIAEAEAAPVPAPQDALFPVWADQVQPAPWKEGPRG
ncbi:MAG TPA: thiamine pyrophosphate-dependent dehydrogenase E1 component subunit alpha, partial [Ardenticatenaceae bacterium]|nr:thiamine pyrophosphate-dependent dehydrogenase E1 component subunit alpha [Ardenticatenaceae bacterium]